MQSKKNLNSAEAVRTRALVIIRDWLRKDKESPRHVAIACHHHVNGGGAGIELVFSLSRRCRGPAEVTAEADLKKIQSFLTGKFMDEIRGVAKASGWNTLRVMKCPDVKDYFRGPYCWLIQERSAQRRRKKKPR